MGSEFFARCRDIALGEEGGHGGCAQAVVQERSGFGGAQVKDVSCSPGEDLGVRSHLTAGGGQTWAVRSQSINSLNSLCVCVAGLLFVCVLEFYSLRLQGQITWM